MKLILNHIKTSVGNVYTHLKNLSMNLRNRQPLIFAHDAPAASCWSPYLAHLAWFAWLSTGHLALDQSCQPIRFRHLPLLCPQRERNQCHSAAAGCPQWVLNFVYIKTTLETWYQSSPPKVFICILCKSRSACLEANMNHYWECVIIKQEDVWNERDDLVKVRQTTTKNSKREKNVWKLCIFAMFDQMRLFPFIQSNEPNLKERIQNFLKSFL